MKQVLINSFPCRIVKVRSWNSGVALSVVITFIFIFSAIILAVIFTATSAYRKTAYFRDKLIAQQLAEIGIQDVLNKLNYTYHTPGYYYGFDTSGNCFISTSQYTSFPQTCSYTVCLLTFWHKFP